MRLVLEMVCCLTGDKAKTWDDIRKAVSKDEFASKILNFDVMAASPKSIFKVQEQCLANKELTFAAVDRASKSSGALFKWVQSQIRYTC